MDNAPLIDTDHLDKYVMGDTSLRDEVLTIFNDQAVVLEQQFSDAQSDEDWTEAAHALKGASRGIGAWALGDLCDDAESLIGVISDKTEKRAALLKKISDQIKATRTASEVLCAS
ncbi:MAG: hypothetical protein DHS20C05_11660 [Hyphococcus sp.]|nr:MAG: hypothetical protein DHS20C05_11660 [Marinicaulis sp.]